MERDGRAAVPFYYGRLNDGSYSLVMMNKGFISKLL